MLFVYLVFLLMFLAAILVLKIFFAHPIICMILILLYLGFVKYNVSIPEKHHEDETIIQENYHYSGNNEDIIDVVYEEKV